MRKKNKLAKPTLAESKSAIAFGAAFLLMCVGGIYAVYHVSSSHSVRPDLNQVPVYFKQAKDATPFPSTLDPTQFEIANVREAYSVAKEIPDVLAQQPCYCYCQRQWHRTLLDGFTTFLSPSSNISINKARSAGRLSLYGRPANQIPTAP